MPKHSRSNGDGGVPDWFFWLITFCLLVIAVMLIIAYR